MSVHLQEGLYRICRERIARDDAYRAVFGNLADSGNDALKFSDYRDYRLRETLKHVYQNSVFYRKLFDEHSIVLSEINTIDDLGKLPFTDPGDLASGGYDFLCVSQGDVEKQVTFLSSGTTGIKKKVFFSAADVRTILRFLSAGMNSVTHDTATVHIILPNSHGRGIGELLSNSLKIAGFDPYVTDMTWSSERQIDLVKEKHPNVIFGNTRSIYRMTKEMTRSVDLSQLGVDVIFLTMEHASAAMVRNLEKAWKCRVCMHYGLAEMGWGLAVECAHAPGYHYNEMDVIAEVVDPKTGKVLENGQEGELVFTSIGREAMPLIRYRSHDIATLMNGPCACGRTLQRIGYVRKRMESTITTPGGKEITPALLDEVLYAFDDVIDYSAHIDYKTGRGALSLSVELLDRHEDIQKRISQTVADFCVYHLGMDLPAIEYLEKGALSAMCGEKKLIRAID